MAGRLTSGWSGPAGSCPTSCERRWPPAAQPRVVGLRRALFRGYRRKEHTVRIRVECRRLVWRAVRVHSVVADPWLCSLAEGRARRLGMRGRLLSVERVGLLSLARPGSGSARTPGCSAFYSRRRDHRCGRGGREYPRPLRATDCGSVGVNVPAVLGNCRWSCADVVLLPPGAHSEAASHMRWPNQAFGGMRVLQNPAVLHAASMLQDPALSPLPTGLSAQSAHCWSARAVERARVARRSLACLGGRQHRAFQFA